MNEQLRKEIEMQRHYAMLMYRYRRLHNLPYRRLRYNLFKDLHIEQICNFFGRTLKTKYKQL